MIARKNLLHDRKESLKFIAQLDISFQKKYLSQFFYYNLKISKSKKSEQYSRDKIDIFIRLFDEHFARHFESHWRETGRHTDRQTIPHISLKTPSPPPLTRAYRFMGWLRPCEEKSAAYTDASRFLLI